MGEIIVETSAGSPAPPFGGATDDLLAFLSFLAAERYGSTHELSMAAKLLRKQHRIDTGPLFDFGDAAPEDDADRAILERLWQPAEPLAAAAAACAAAIRRDSQVQALTQDYPRLPDRLAELAAISRWAEARGARVRVTYRM
ncbi:MAG: hypothetical protein ACYDCQ_06410 [Dehalococcoidia bacterium]